MRAVRYERFQGPLSVVEQPEPAAPDRGVVVRVEAAGLCRSDWHGWMGHDPDIRLPQVPGHEWAGTILAVGPGVTRYAVGQRVTAPFVCGCGRCRWCAQGDQQVCERQAQPGFTYAGAFAEQLVVPEADLNLVALPDSLEAGAAAALGCRFATAYRAVLQQGRPAPGSWVAVHGCGGVGLSAVMVAVAAGARVLAADLSNDALALARELGAELALDASTLAEPAEIGAAVRELTDGGAALSLDAVGSHATSAASVYSLRRRGRHVQVGLLPGDLGVPALPMDRVIGHELEIVGSHGMAAHAYPEMLAAVAVGRIPLSQLVTRHIALDEVVEALPAMSRPGPAGVTVISPQLDPDLLAHPHV